MTFPYAIGQIPIHYNAFNTGRPVAEGTIRARNHATAIFPISHYILLAMALSIPHLRMAIFSLDKNSAGIKTITGIRNRNQHWRPGRGGSGSVVYPGCGCINSQAHKKN